ncbi:hypothetical protein NVP1285O_50 [Vibrio phage 1.285.O._10N.286.55.C12]|nr:hypothetical protein NVP1033O_45 [Vibrio phage 1.033.O._10N.222.49.B8]AUS01448.1 hypothetical protein NVP1285O_50 [Vibrio phage 1.285.O._10N.286.55.C12]
MEVYFYSGEAGDSKFDGSVTLPNKIFSNKEYDMLRDGIYKKVAEKLSCDVSLVVLTNLSRL